MTTYNTGNPVGSADPRDLYDNAQSLDQAVTGQDPTWRDRFGRERPSWTSMIGYQDLGDYGAGITIAGYNQLVREDGRYYKLDPAVTVPYVTSGSWSNDVDDFVDVGDGSLRSELAMDGGSDLVGLEAPVTNSPTTVAKNARNHQVINILTEGANPNGVANNAAILATLTGAAYQDYCLEVPHGIFAVASDIVLATCQALRGLSTGGSHTDTDRGAIIRAVSGGAFTNALINMSGHSQLKGLKLDGNGVAATAVLLGDSSTGFKNIIEDCRLGGFTGNVITGSTSDSWFIRGCEFNGGALTFGMISLTSVSVGNIKDCRFVPSDNCAFLIKVSSGADNSKVEITGCLFEGSNGGVDQSDFQYAIIVDADDVSIVDNIFQMHPDSTVFDAHILVKNGARNTYIGRNTYQNAGASGILIEIESGAVDTIIDASILGWSAGAGVTAQITDNGTNTMVQFGGDTSSRFLLSDIFTIAALSGGRQFVFDTSLALLYFNKHSNNNNFAGVVSGILTLNSNGSLDLKAAAASSVRAQVGGTVMGQFSDTANANELAAYLKIHGGSIQRLSVGAADSGGTGYRLVRIPN